MVRLDLGNAVLTGVDFPGLIKLSSYWQVEGKWISVDFDEINCMVGIALAKKMEIRTGDEITVSNRATGFHQKLYVKGIIETGETEDEQLFVNLSVAQKALSMEGSIHYAKFSLISEGADMDLLAEKLNREFEQIDAKPLRKLSYSEGKILDKIKGIMAFISLIILIATSFGVMTTLMAIITERSKEIALMKSLGAENRQVIFQFLSETGLITLAGAFLGIGIGFLLAQILGHSVFGSSITFRPPIIPLVVGISFFTCTLAALVPVRMAMRILPAQGLKGE
jgi:putative ABC transport system permease protein